MSQIRVNHLTFAYEGSFDNIFENVSFSIDTDWKLGFIGRNGKGKSTFLNLLMGKYEYTGSITSNAVFDYFPYDISEEKWELPAAEFVEKFKVNLELWRVYAELLKLQADAEIMYRPWKTLSFGEQTKVMLAVLFSGENDFLLIDEPTNHLDDESRKIVKRYLASKKGFILVSHDRDLLDACVDHVLVLNRSTIEVQAGNFSSWWENKEKKDNFAVAENEKHKKEISKLNEAAKRVRNWSEKSENSKIGFDPIKENDRSISTRAYIGSKTKKMQARVKQMEQRIQTEIAEKEGLLVDLEQPIDLKLNPLTHHKEVLVSAYQYGLRYQDADKMLFENQTFEIRNGDRLFISGKNGSGKTSLIKAILGETKNLLEQGDLRIASGIEISYINQDTSYLRGTVHSFCTEHQLEESLLCSILRQLDIGREQFAKNLEEYSEGQKKKVVIAASLLKPAHLYIWDEPLNYIDVFSRMQLENLILKYQPTMLVVDHDVRFREKIATKTVWL